MDFSTNVAGTTRHLYAKKKKKKTSASYLEKNNSKWIIDLNVKYKTIKLPKKKNRRKSCSLKLGNSSYIRHLKHDP